MSSPIQTTDTSDKTPVEAETPSRIIGRLDGAREGPVIMVLAGMHGNEPAGIRALEKVFAALQGFEKEYKGKLVGLRCNLRALFEGVRFVDEDMNRLWFSSIIDKIRRCPVEELASSERVEIKRLLGVIDREIPERSRHPVIFVDLHSFSSQGSMFTITARKKSHIKILASLHAPMIFGIDEALRGTALRYFQRQEYISFALEGGNHQNQMTIYNKRAALMLLIARAGSLPKAKIPGYKEYDTHLKQSNRQLPARVELVYQHIIEEGDEFQMRPGYRNFQPIKQGEWLASDRNGRIRAQCDGYILMPLYQKQGDDGFFIVQDQT